MIRDIKTLGLAVVAVLALGATGASAASGVEFHAEVEPVTLKISTDGTQLWWTPAATITCNSVSGDATMTRKTASTITVREVLYTGAGSSGRCIIKTIFGNIEATPEFSTDECDYVFHSNGEVDIECVKAGGITISGPGCTITLPTQTGLKGVTYDNKESFAKRDVTVTAVLKGIHGTAVGPLCSSQGTFTTGEATGKSTVQAFEDAIGGALVSFWVE